MFASSSGGNGGGTPKEYIGGTDVGGGKPKNKDLYTRQTIKWVSDQSSRHFVFVHTLEYNTFVKFIKSYHLINESPHNITFILKIQGYGDVKIDGSDYLNKNNPELLGKEVQIRPLENGYFVLSDCILGIKKQKTFEIIELRTSKFDNEYPIKISSPLTSKATTPDYDSESTFYLGFQVNSKLTNEITLPETFAKLHLCNKIFGTDGLNLTFECKLRIFNELETLNGFSYKHSIPTFPMKTIRPDATALNFREVRVSKAYLIICDYLTVRNNVPNIVTIYRVDGGIKEEIKLVDSILKHYDSTIKHFKGRFFGSGGTYTDKTKVFTFNKLMASVGFDKVSAKDCTWAYTEDTNTSKNPISFSNVKAKRLAITCRPYVEDTDSRLKSTWHQLDVENYKLSFDSTIETRIRVSNRKTPKHVDSKVTSTSKDALTKFEKQKGNVDAYDNDGDEYDEQDDLLILIYHSHHNTTLQVYRELRNLPKNCIYIVSPEPKDRYIESINNYQPLILSALAPNHTIQPTLYNDKTNKYCFMFVPNILQVNKKDASSRITFEISKDDDFKMLVVYYKTGSKGNIVNLHENHLLLTVDENINLDYNFLATNDVYVYKEKPLFSSAKHTVENFTAIYRKIFYPPLSPIVQGIDNIHIIQNIGSYLDIFIILTLFSKLKDITKKTIFMFNVPVNVEIGHLLKDENVARLNYKLKSIFGVDMYIVNHSLHTFGNLLIFSSASYSLDEIKVKNNRDYVVVDFTHFMPTITINLLKKYDTAYDKTIGTCSMLWTVPTSQGAVKGAPSSWQTYNTTSYYPINFNNYFIENINIGAVLSKMSLSSGATNPRYIVSHLTLPDFENTEIAWNTRRYQRFERQLSSSRTNTSTKENDERTGGGNIFSYMILEQQILLPSTIKGLCKNLAILTCNITYVVFSQSPKDGEIPASIRTQLDKIMANYANVKVVEKNIYGGVVFILQNNVENKKQTTTMASSKPPIPNYKIMMDGDSIVFSSFGRKFVIINEVMTNSIYVNKNDVDFVWLYKQPDSIYCGFRSMINAYKSETLVNDVKGFSILSYSLEPATNLYGATYFQEHLVKSENNSTTFVAYITCEIHMFPSILSFISSLNETIQTRVPNIKFLLLVFIKNMKQGTCDQKYLHNKFNDNKLPLSYYSMPHTGNLFAFSTTNFTSSGNNVYNLGNYVLVFCDDDKYQILEKYLKCVDNKQNYRTVFYTKPKSEMCIVAPILSAECLIDRIDFAHGISGNLLKYCYSGRRLDNAITLQMDFGRPVIYIIRCLKQEQFLILINTLVMLFLTDLYANYAFVIYGLTNAHLNGIYSLGLDDTATIEYYTLLNIYINNKHFKYQLTKLQSMGNQQVLLIRGRLNTFDIESRMWHNDMVVSLPDSSEKSDMTVELSYTNVLESYIPKSNEYIVLKDSLIYVGQRINRYFRMYPWEQLFANAKESSYLSIHGQLNENIAAISFLDRYNKRARSQFPGNLQNDWLIKKVPETQVYMIHLFENETISGGQNLFIDNLITMLNANKFIIIVLSIFTKFEPYSYKEYVIFDKDFGNGSKRHRILLLGLDKVYSILNYNINTTVVENTNFQVELNISGVPYIFIFSNGSHMGTPVGSGFNKPHISYNINGKRIFKAENTYRENHMKAIDFPAVLSENLWWTSFTYVNEATHNTDKNLEICIARINMPKKTLEISCGDGNNTTAGETKTWSSILYTITIISNVKFELNEQTMDFVKISIDGGKFIFGMAASHSILSAKKNKDILIYCWESHEYNRQFLGTHDYSDETSVILKPTKQK